MRAIFPILATMAAVAAQEAEETFVPPVVEEIPSMQVDRVTSRSGQFTVTGGDGWVRGTVAVLAEAAKTELLTLTEEKDEWKVPVAIHLQGEQNDAVPVRTVVVDEIHYNETGYRISVRAHVGRGLDQELLKRVVTEVMLYERALKKRPVDSDVPLDAPVWLVEGLRETVAWKEKTSDRRLYEALFRRGGLFKIDDLFSADSRKHENLDAAMRAAFRVSSGALVMALLDQPQGKNSFRAFLTEAAMYEGETPALLRKHFPELNLSETSLAKWWMLQLANSGTAPLTDVFSVIETEEILTEALKLNFRSEDGSFQERPLESWQEVIVLKEGERRDAVKMAEEGLVRLSYRCFPSYRPLLVEYQTVLTSIARGDGAKVAEKVTSLQESREVMVAKANRGKDFMDYFEITRATETSGAFDDYLRLKQRLKTETRDRNDELSGYLDRMERLFSREGAREVSSIAR